MRPQKSWFFNPKVWLAFLGGMILLFATLAVVQIFTGVSNEELQLRRVELNQVGEASTVETQDEALSLREDRVAQVGELEEQIQNDTQSLIENENFQAYEDRYGRDIRAILESELTQNDISTVQLVHQPLFYVDDTFPLNLVLDEQIHIFAYYDFRSDQLIPQYISREGSGE